MKYTASGDVALCTMPTMIHDDTAEGKQAELDAAIIEWLEAHLDA